jgi:hypothetical protein
MSSPPSVWMREQIIFRRLTIAPSFSIPHLIAPCSHAPVPACICIRSCVMWQILRPLATPWGGVHHLLAAAAQRPAASLLLARQPRQCPRATGAGLQGESLAVAASLEAMAAAAGGGCCMMGLGCRG